ncbi:MAG: ATP-dependent helicase [Ignavibacteria bacterium]|nr:ATP-dependent helicase [Ignavibacteria bacterium]
MTKKYKISRIDKAGSIKQEIDESRFSINYKSELNEAQFEAASAIEGTFLVIAGAGTGKTRTLVYRVARLIESGYDPKSILLLTFTRKAAREMMGRASLLLDDRCSKVNGGTFHSFANLTLRKYAKAAGIDSGFTILDQGDSEDIINLIRGQMNLASIKKRFPKKNTINNILSLALNTGVNPEIIIQNEYPHFMEFTDQILKIGRIFESYKRKNNLLDYDDLLVFLRKFLQEMSPAARSFLSDIKFIMVDEYQDTNKLQADIVKALAQINNNVMVVGDDSQSIYSFRGADFKNIMEFPKFFPNARLIKLEENFRSTQSILDLTNFIISNADEKYPKNLFTKRKEGRLPSIICAANENMQSRFITDRILELREEGVPLSDIAVLFRSSYHSFDLEIELNKANIPYIKFGGMKFIEAAHVKDMLAFLRISANPKDIVSWYRVLLLHEGIGAVSAQKIIEAISNNEIGFKSNPKAIISGKYDKLENLFSLIYELHNSNKTPADKADVVYGYYYPLFKENYDDFNKRKKDLDIVLRITEKYETMDELLTDMALEPPRDSVSDIDEESKEDEFLTLSTIHSAKGLEWHSVFVIHALDRFFPSAQSFGSTDGLEEERRLMYVAATRAKQNLHITYPQQIFERHSGVTFSKPSRFIEGISENLAEEWLLEEDF